MSWLADLRKFLISGEDAVEDALERAPEGKTVHWINQSQGALSRLECVQIVAALNMQAKHLAHEWGVALNKHVLSTTPTSGTVKAYWLPNSDVADALGYHTVDPQGDPYIKVFTDTVLLNGGQILEGSLSVAVTSSHEACELAVDPACTRTAKAPDGVVWAFEVADPVESYFYNVTVGNTTVSLSDFVIPGFFGEIPHTGFDFMGLVPKPFMIAPGGYAVQNGQAVFADLADGTPYPEFRKKAKEFPVARTYRRTHP